MNIPRYGVKQYEDRGKKKSNFLPHVLGTTAYSIRKKLFLLKNFRLPHRESRKKKIHSNAGPFQETRKIPNKQSKLTLKGTRKNNSKQIPK